MPYCKLPLPRDTWESWRGRHTATKAKRSCYSWNWIRMLAVVLFWSRAFVWALSFFPSPHFSLCVAWVSPCVCVCVWMWVCVHIFCVCDEWIFGKLHTQVFVAMRKNTKLFWLRSIPDSPSTDFKLVANFPCMVWRSWCPSSLCYNIKP